MEKHLEADTTTTGEVVVFCTFCTHSVTGPKESVLRWAGRHKEANCKRALSTY